MNKEIYFSNDIYQEVGKKLNVNPKIIEQAFLSFLRNYKKDIEEGDSIIYSLPYLGDMMISKTDAQKEIRRLEKRKERAKKAEEKEDIQKKIDNYRLRLKKIKVEIERLKHNRTYLNSHKRKRMKSIQMGLTTPENIKRAKLFMSHTLEEVMNKQNEYAHNYYKNSNL